MRTLTIIITIIILSHHGFSDNRNQEKPQRWTKNLRNFYNTDDEHELHVKKFLQKRLVNENLVLVNNSVINADDDHEVRHKHGATAKIKKLGRCRRYAQNYDSSIIIRPNCYYNRCRQNYCGYCPTSGCRRRCNGCTYQSTTLAPVTTTLRKPATSSCNCDPHGSRFTSCDNKGQCICKENYTALKCNICKDRFWKRDTECVPCDCDKHGSIDQICEKESGFCHCKNGVGTQRCNVCMQGFYGDIIKGCKACDTCDKEGHICHPETGKCTCPPLTVGAKCEKCVKNAWGYEPGIGCKGCDCSTSGSSNSQCDAGTGRCTCKIGFEGEKCDRCSFGYYGYKNCRKCSCNAAGTRPENCQNRNVCGCADEGCRCKTNVQGRKCDVCKDGTFGLDAENQLGCKDCFCFGRSKKCTAGKYTWQTFTTDQVIHDVCIDNKPCWRLPDKFTGDLTQSYGGYFTISTGSVMSPYYKISIIGNNVILEASATDSETKLVETSWKLYRDDNTPPKMPRDCYIKLTRACMMVVLQKVTKIYIQPGATPKSTEFVEVVLQTAKTVAGDLQVTSVESCDCPKEYTSSSCQDPNTGYFRYRPQNLTHEKYIDALVGVAKPCECNGRSTTCDAESGHCYNCTHFTTGPHCEFCAEGYFKDLKENCLPCLCPSEKENFATRCTIGGKKHNKFTCFCKKGYSGAKCDKCDNAYWGNPLTDGLCSPCNCNRFGSKDAICNKLTGMCTCLPGFSGKMCSDCSSPREVIQNGVCTPCDECTQILFNTIDSLSGGLSETMDLFKDGLGPPWPILDKTIVRHNLLSDKFTNNFVKANELVQNAKIPELETRVERMKKDLETQKPIMAKQISTINTLEKDSKTLSAEILTLYNTIDDLLKNFDEFGNSHVDTQEALKEAKKILSDINKKSKDIASPQNYKDFFVQCHQVYKTVNEIYNSNLNPDDIRMKLNNLRKRLGHLNSILDQTHLNNKLAKNKNKQNANRIATLNQTISELTSKKIIIDNEVQALFKKIASTNEILIDIEKIYEELKKLELSKATEKLEENDVGDDQYEVLTNVSEHVKALQSKIKNYKSIFNFTTEEWKRINASGAYDSVLKRVEEARKTAEEAQSIIEDTTQLLYPDNDDSLTDKTNLAKAFSDRLKQRITNLQNPAKDFKKVRDDLEKLKYDILNNGRNNNDLISVLYNMRQQIQQQNVSLDRMETVMENATRVSNEMVDIENKVKNLNISTQYEVIKTYHEYLNLTSKDEIEKLADNITSTRMQLETVNPRGTYFDRIKDGNEKVFQNNRQNLEALQKKLKNLKNKIQFAKEAADSINIALSIAKCKRTYHVQKDIFKFLSVTFKCKRCHLLTLKNIKNETIELKVQNNNNNGEVIFAYKNLKKPLKLLPDKTNTLTVTRIGSLIQFNVNDENQGQLFDNTVFEIDEGNFLHIGNRSTDDKQPDACLHKVELNDQVIGLWNFVKTDGVCPGCAKDTNTSVTETYLFNGNGWRNVTGATEKWNPQNFGFEFNFATFDENSLIFYAQDKTNSCSYVSLTLNQGRLQLKARHIDGTNIEITSEGKYNNGDSTRVRITLAFNQKQTYSLMIGDKEKEKVLSRDLTRSNVFKIKKSDVFIGGIPVVFDMSCMEVTHASFLGHLNPVEARLSDAALTNSYNTRVASGQLQFNKARFSGKGYLQVQLSNITKLPENLYNIHFLLKPNTDNGFVMTVNSLLDIYITNNNLAISSGEQDHIFGSLLDINVIELNVTAENIAISINNNSKSPIPQSTTLPERISTLYLGQDGKKRHLLGFKGGISNIVINNKPITFNTDTVERFEHVEIGRDKSLQSTTQVTMKNSFGSIFETNSIREMQNTEGCPLIANYETDPNAVKFGDKPNSFIFIENSFWKRDYVLEFQFRTFYPNGLLFLSTGVRQQNHFNALEIQQGKLKLRVKGKKIKTVVIPEKINDGLWHHVQIKQTGLKKKRKLTFALDGVSKKPMRMPKNNLKNELYVGGVPDGFPVYLELRNELHPFRGCMRSLKINDNLQVLVKNKKSVSYNNIGQCFANSEKGAYFGGDAYAIYKEDFKVNKVLELSLEFKTVEQNGILLSVSNYGNSPALSVELQNGAVVMTIDMGNGAVSNVTNSVDSEFTLCNNQWHNITALYSSSELTVNVDGIRKSWVQSDVNSLMDEIEAPLYVGGLPDNAPSGTLKIKENFKGCIRKLKIEDTLLDWTDMRELNNVLLNACPVVV